MPVDLTIVESTTELGQTVVEVVLEGASEPGPAGPGVPAGGTDGQVLTKTSATDYATAWEDPTGGGGGGAPTDATYLVTTANGTLSAEVVVGATPGGELGGTWASPTVDATHAGSTHAAVQAAAEATAAAALSAHESDTTSVHGITDTSTLYRSGGTDVAVADGGTGASTAAGARANLDLEPGTDIPSQASFDDHSARHENGGADEISIAGLDGTPSALQTHLDDTSDAHDASAISVLDTNGDYTATDVEGVLAEIAPQLGGAGGLFDAIAYIRDEKAANTNGGTPSTGSFQTRTLQTEVSDPDGIVSISSNQFTLQAGTYLIIARAPAYATNRAKAKIRNVTDSTDALIGKSAFAETGSSDDSWVFGVITIAGAKAFEVQQRTETSTANVGLGVASNFGVVEVYTEVLILRFA